jgi:hypothetical protein
MSTSWLVWYVSIMHVCWAAVLGLVDGHMIQFLGLAWMTSAYGRFNVIFFLLGSAGLSIVGLLLPFLNGRLLVPETRTYRWFIPQQFILGVWVGAILIETWHTSSWLGYLIRVGYSLPLFCCHLAAVLDWAGVFTHRRMMIEHE